MNKLTGRELEHFLQRVQLNNAAFADVIGVTKSCVDYWVIEKRKVPPTTAKLVRYFDKHPERILDFK